MQDINELLRKAEMQHHQLQMEVTFQKNMEFLKSVSPELYQRFADYSPEELRISFDSNNHLNLVNFNLNNRPVYQGDPLEFCQQQFERYRDKPAAAPPHLMKTENAVNRFYQVELINDIVDNFQDEINNSTITTRAPIGMMLIIGCGLGYHIPILSDELNIQNLCIFDPHPDSFYASLHVIDWRPVIKSYLEKNGSIKFYIGMSKEVVLSDMRTLGNKVGLFNLGVTFVYKHFDSKQGQAFLDRYRQQYHLNLTGIGFLEDEQISVAHSIDNLNKSIPVYKKANIPITLPPAVIVGNGPSLDGLVETLQKLGDKAVIFSCGSATPTLYRLGIKPHVHIEMERTSPTATWLSEGTDADYLKDITLFALNTVSPDTYALFDKKGMFNKPNDLGALLIEKELGRKLPELGFCNPTVTNCGLSAALYLGFDEIYLVGVDLGMISEDQHHSKTSLYFALSDRTQSIVNDRYKKNTYTRKGNFRDEILTNTDFETSRTNMETIIRHIAGAKPLKVYNMNDGAFIEGTIPLKVEDMREIPDAEDCREVLDILLDKSFLTYRCNELSSDDVLNKYFSEFFQVSEQLHLAENLESPDLIAAELNRVFHALKSIESQSPTSEILIRGSINSFFTVLARACYYIEDKDRLRQVYNHCRDHYEEFLRRSLVLTRERMLELDSTSVIWDC